MAGALVDDLEVDGGARRGNGPSSRPQIGSVRQPRWLTTRLHLGGLELDLRSTLTIFLPKHRQLPALDDLDCTLGLTLRARVLSPDKKQTRAHPASEERSRTSLVDPLRTCPTRSLSPHASAGAVTTRDGSGGASEFPPNPNPGAWASRGWPNGALIHSPRPHPSPPSLLSSPPCVAHTSLATSLTGPMRSNLDCRRSSLAALFELRDAAGG